MSLINYCPACSRASGTCALRALVSQVPHVSGVTRALVPRAFYARSALKPRVICSLRALVPHVLRYLRAFVPLDLVPHVPYALRALVSHVLLYLTCPLCLVPCILHVPVSSFLLLSSHPSGDFLLPAIINQ